MDDSKDTRSVLANIRDSQSPLPKADPIEITLLFRFTILHLIGLVLVAAVSCRLATALKPELGSGKEMILLSVAILQFAFRLACYVVGVFIGRYTAIRGQWWDKVGKQPGL
jgi:hypothetical protein